MFVEIFESFLCIALNLDNSRIAMSGKDLIDKEKIRICKDEFMHDKICHYIFIYVDANFCS